MAYNGPVILVDDDVEDQELVRSILAELGCEKRSKVLAALKPL